MAAAFTVHGIWRLFLDSHFVRGEFPCPFDICQTIAGSRMAARTGRAVSISLTGPRPQSYHFGIWQARRVIGSGLAVGPPDEWAGCCSRCHSGQRLQLMWGDFGSGAEIPVRQLRDLLASGADRPQVNDLGRMCRAHAAPAVSDNTQFLRRSISGASSSAMPSQ